MKQQRYSTRSGYIITVQKFKGGANHIIIEDSNLYPDNDSRSEEIWRTQGLLIPINDKKDLKAIKKLFKL